MEYRTLGAADLRVSVICHGTWSIATRDAFWDGQDRADSIAAIYASLDAGVNFFDTAPAYGDGESEEILGEALAGRREGVIIASKVPPTDLEPARLRARCERSLRALRTDVIDLYQIHWPSKTLPLEPALRELESLRTEGKIRAIGVSNFGIGFLSRLAAIGRAESNQLPYSLLWRPIEYEIQPRCARLGMSILCYSPLAQGLLAGTFASPDEVPVKRARTRLFSRQRPMTRHGEEGCEDEAFAAIARVRELATSAGLPMGRMSLAWLLRRSAVTSVIAGARNAAQARENAAAGDLRLDDDLVRALEQATDRVKELMGRNADPWEHISRMEPDAPA